MKLFREPQDYAYFLERLRFLLSKQGAPSRGAPLRIVPFTTGEFSLLSYCIMPNHFHFEILQNGNVPAAKLLLRMCTSFSMYFNRKYGHVGHVFQDQFKAVPVRNDRQMTALSAYIHQNPKVAGLVKDTKEWPYSSYPDYLGIRNNDLCDKDLIMQQFRDPHHYEEFVDDRLTSIKESKEIESVFLD